MKKFSFIVVSNRLPVTVSKEGKDIKFQPSPGGLATAMSSVDTKGDTLWIGWPGINAEELTASDKQKITRKLREFNCAPVFLTGAQIENFYEGYSNETLWPLFHYFQSVAQFEEHHWQAYKEVNLLFSKAVQKYADASSTVWVHDYHLLLLPALIRKSLPEATIGFFLHIPFPSFEIFRLLPSRKELLEGLLGADMVGFHVYDYVRHFVSSVTRTLGLKTVNGSIYSGSRIIKADAFPIGIDYEKFKEASLSSDTSKEIDSLNEHFNGKKIILSVDRLDYSKGIEHRLEAFENFLKKYPSYHKKVSMVMVAVPSRTEVDAYKDLRDTVEQTVSRINGKYADVEWTPISYQFQNQEFTKLVALYSRADIALVTPVRDGMNLVAKEYLASKQNSTGVLILSELAGAVDELTESIIINPNDTDGIVEAIKTAIKMPEKQKKSRVRAMQRRISSYDVQSWAKDFLEQLEASKKQQSTRNLKLLSSDSRQQIISGYNSSKKRLIILDYDGTLRPFVKSPLPGDAAPPKKTLSLVENLARSKNNTVCIISGRSQAALDTWFGKLPVELIAEHGYWTKNNGKWRSESAEIADYKRRVIDIMVKYTERTPGAVLEDKASALVWHYRNVNPELAYVRKNSLRHDLKLLLEDTDADVFSGHKVLEIKPKNVNKGIAVKNLIGQNKFDFILCAGDDYTDEDMFLAIPDGHSNHTIKIGLDETAARYQLPASADLLKLLQTLGNDSQQ